MHFVTTALNIAGLAHHRIQWGKFKGSNNSAAIWYILICFYQFKWLTKIFLPMIFFSLHILNVSQHQLSSELPFTFHHTTTSSNSCFHVHCKCIILQILASIKYDIDGLAFPELRLVLVPNGGWKIPCYKYCQPASLSWCCKTQYWSAFGPFKAKRLL